LNKHISISAVSLLLAGLLCSCSKSPQPGKELRAVSTVTVSSTLPTQNDARYAAIIVPEAKVELGFRTGGYVEWIDQRRGADGTLRNLDAGDAVASGSVLARLRPAEYAARTSEAEAGIKEASAAGNEAKAQLLQASAEAQRAEIDWQRAERLYRQAAMTKPDYDPARTHDHDALAQLQSAKAAIALQASREAAAAAQSREARAAFDDTILKAPFSGVILARTVEKGALASIGEPAFTLADHRSRQSIVRGSRYGTTSITIGGADSCIYRGSGRRRFSWDRHYDFSCRRTQVFHISGRSNAHK
jgi:multidrug efflux pump subunit AcrA (membrane-fusion protein)